MEIALHHGSVQLLAEDSARHRYFSVSCHLPPDLPSPRVTVFMNWEDDDGMIGADTRILSMDGTYTIRSEGIALPDSILEFSLTTAGQGVQVTKQRDQTWVLYVFGVGNSPERALHPPFVCTINVS